MSKIAKQLTELVGNTPLLELNKYSQAKGVETPVIAKVEFFNPGGSVKDRIALAMIEDAEQKGSVKCILFILLITTTPSLPVIIPWIIYKCHCINNKL